MWTRRVLRAGQRYRQVVRDVSTMSVSGSYLRGLSDLVGWLPTEG